MRACLCVCCSLLIDRIEKRFLSLRKLLTFEDEEERKRERHVNAHEKEEEERKTRSNINGLGEREKKERNRTSLRNISTRCAVDN